MHGWPQTLMPPYETPTGIVEPDHLRIVDVDADPRRNGDRLAVDEDIEMRVDVIGPAFARPGLETRPRPPVPADLVGRAMRQPLRP